MLEQTLREFGINVEPAEDLNLNELTFEDSVEELEVAQIFANCNSCGDIGVLEKDCWCGGCFNISRDPNVFSGLFEPAAPHDALRNRNAVSTGGWEHAASRPIASTEPAAPWGLNALGEPAARPQMICCSTGEPLSPGDFGPKPCADGEEPESRLCTGCGGIDRFLLTPPFACLCGNLKSQPASDEWLGIALDPKPPMNNASAA